MSYFKSKFTLTFAMAMALSFGLSACGKRKLECERPQPYQKAEITPDLTPIPGFKMPPPDPAWEIPSGNTATFTPANIDPKNPRAPTLNPRCLQDPPALNNAN